jgi:hypothetical protein
LKLVGVQAILAPICRVRRGLTQALGTNVKDDRGCTKSEVAEIEEAFGSSLPAVYRSWLLSHGRVPPDKFIGSDCSYPALLKLNSWAQEILEENGQPFHLTTHDFVFLMHQGYHFLYFNTANGDADPVVLEYQDGWGAPSVVDRRLSGWLVGA